MNKMKTEKGMRIIPATATWKPALVVGHFFPWGATSKNSGKVGLFINNR